MRRNLTISFDGEFIKLLDETRGVIPRGQWIESQGGPSNWLSTEEPPAKDERSPEPQAGSEATQSPPAAQRAAKPPLQRPIIQKRGT